jgi:hypothetical protein
MVADVADGRVKTFVLATRVENLGAIAEAES